MAPSLSRRAVLRGLGASAASLVFPLRAWAVAASDPPAVCAGYRPRVAAGWVPAGEPGAFERALRSVVDASTDFAWLAPGDRVLVKIASNSGSRFPATSSPAALFALARLLYARGAGTVWAGDQAGVHLVHHTRKQRKGSTRALMQQNGLWQAATAAGAVPLAFEEAGYDAYLAERVPGGGRWRDEVWIARAAAEVDHIVYLPRVSHHTLAFATLGLKLGVGWLREDSRLELHRDADSFAEKFAEVNRLPAIADRSTTPPSPTPAARAAAPRRRSRSSGWTARRGRRGRARSSRTTHRLSVPCSWDDQGDRLPALGSPPSPRVR